MTNETRTPSPHICPSCKASFADDGEFGAHMGGQCTPSPADGRVLLCTDPVCPADDPHNQGALGCHFARSPDAPGSVAGAVPSPALSSEWKERAGADSASGSRSRHGEGAPADGIDARGLAWRLRKRFEHPHPRPMGSLVNPDGPEAADLIEAQSATIARLNAEVERMRGICCAADYYIHGLEAVQNRCVIRDLGERKAGYVAALASKEG